MRVQVARRNWAILRPRACIVPTWQRCGDDPDLDEAIDGPIDGSIDGPAGRHRSYGLILMLHGYGGNGRSLVTRSYQNFANKNGFIIVSPDAKKPAKGKWNEDLPEQLLGTPTQHWWSYRSDGFVNGLIDDLCWKYPIDRNRVVISGMSMGGGVRSSWGALLRT